MIQRKASKITDSLVNSTHEDHLNVSKAIRDDAPITNLTTAVKSINFESDGDGAYVLRYPLVKKEDFKTITNPTTYPFNFYLYDNIHKVTVKNRITSTHTSPTPPDTVKNLQISNAEGIILKFYDSNLELHTIQFDGVNNIDVPWLEIESTYNAIEHTILNCIIDHKKFLSEYSIFEMDSHIIAGQRREYIKKWSWTLVNTTDNLTPFINTFTYKTLEKLKRFIKIYQDSNNPLIFIIEIIHPELNSITSGLDVGNSNTLDVNLLLDNPYAIRDLYGYGYVSTTKILSYVVKDEVNVSRNDIDNSMIWELTESDFIDSSENAAPNAYFRILVSANPKTFSNRYLILKAFLTTGITNQDYYCCWEESNNEGVDWEICQEFIDKFEDELVIKKVSDITSKEFLDKYYKDSSNLNKESSSYLIDKKVYPFKLSTEDYNQNNKIKNRPDVLVIESPNLNKIYRFTIYLDTKQQSPTPITKTFTLTKTGFSTTSGNLDDDGNLKYNVIPNDGSAPDVDTDGNLVINTASLTVYEPTYGEQPSQRYADIACGNSLRVYTENENCKIKEVQFTLAPSKSISDVEYDVGALIGISKTLPTSADVNIPNDKTTGTGTDYYINIFNVKYDIQYNLTNAIEYITPNYENIMDKFWHSNSSTTSIPIEYLNSSEVYITNIINNIYSFNGSPKPYSDYPNPFNDTSKSIVILPKLIFDANGKITGEERTDVTCTYTDTNGYHRQHVRNTAYRGKTLDYIYMNGFIITKTQDYYNYKLALFQGRYIPSISNHIVFNAVKIEEEISNAEHITISPRVKNNKIEYLKITANGNPEFLEIGDTNPSYEYKTITTTFVKYFYEDYDEYPYFNTSEIFDIISKREGYSIESYNQTVLKIASLYIVYTLSENTEETFTSTYMTSVTGAFKVAYSNETKLVEDLTAEINRIFAIDSKYYFNSNQAQLLVYKDNYVYVSGTNSSIMRLMNSLTLPEEVTKIIPWRGYLLLFSPRNIYLAKYNSDVDSYDVKVLSNTVGVTDVDADTIVPILNSVYFKSGNKIYKLTPNLYAASDDILNIHQISVGVNNIIEDITNTYIESHNFSYATADTYMVFIPIENINTTFCIHYDFVKQVWTMQKYPVYLLDLMKFSNTEAYVKDSDNIYHFNESMNSLVTKDVAQGIPYGDYLTKTPEEIVALYNTATTKMADLVSYMTPIQFEIDFGQKSSNYTLDKQFLETKLVLATLSKRDVFPLSIDIYTDGMPKVLHFDANTDAALWKDSLDDVGILNTAFGAEGQDYNGIFRQLIVKYSGRGKSIRHVISGNSISLFKFYSMNVRARILPKKQ